MTRSTGMPDVTRLETVAFLGTGHMGAPMVRRLAGAGYDLQIWNRTHAKAQELAAPNVTIMTSPAQAVRGAKFVCLCLTDADAIRSILFGTQGLAANIGKGAIVIDFSTIGLSYVREFASRVNEVGAFWLDAPVSGGVAGAEAGKLVVFVGGAEEVLTRSSTLLSSLATRVTLMGDVGAGQATKLCNQLIVSVTLAAIAEATALADHHAIDTDRLAEALRGGFADSAPLQIFGPRMAPQLDRAPKVSDLRTMHKDIVAVQAAAATSGLATPLLHHVEALYASVIDAGFGGEDLPALMRLYRDPRLQGALA